jgi:hypothetical protein
MNSDYKQFGPPHPTFLAVHAAIENILHLTGRGETIEKLMCDLGDNSAFLAHDGTTVLFCRLASFRVLPLVEMQNDEGPPVKPRATASPQSHYARQ